MVYWATTAILAAECLSGGVMGLFRREPFLGVATHLGYPTYFMTILGVWYLLAGIALLVPQFPRLKEWTYAGLIFNHTGALASHAAVGDGVGAVILPIFFTGLTLASWALLPPDRRFAPPN